MQQQRDTNPLVGRDRDLPSRANFLKKVVEMEPTKKRQTPSINYHVCFGHITANDKTNLSKNVAILRI